MADFAPPTGPPPPHLPEGWKAVWNEQYKEWFYVNIYTKKSQWDKPVQPVYAPPGDEPPPPDAPPGYDHSASKPVGPEKGAVSSHTTGEQLFAGASTAPGAGSSHIDTSGDEEFARKLQEEENAHRGGAHSAAGNRGAADSYYNQDAPASYGQQQGGQYGSQSPAQYDPNQVPQGQNPQTSPGGETRGKSKGGFLGKLLGKGKSSSHQQGYGQQLPQQGYGQQYPPQQPGYGYPPQQGYYGGGYPQQQMRPQRQGGLGAGGAAALGVGGGLLGGVLLADAMDGGDDGGDYGGGDDGGFGGDDGGGDFGGGDF